MILRFKLCCPSSYKFNQFFYLQEMKIEVGDKIKFRKTEERFFYSKDDRYHIIKEIISDKHLYKHIILRIENEHNYDCAWFLNKEIPKRL